MICGVQSIAIELLSRCERSLSCTQAFPPGELEEDDIDGRIASGDRLAIHDALSQAVNDLSKSQELLGEVLVEDAETLARLRAITEAKAAGLCTATICSSRWNRKAAATDRSGTKRRGSRSTRPVSHG